MCPDLGRFLNARMLLDGSVRAFFLEVIEMKCDKCELPVDRKDDASILESIRRKSLAALNWTVLVSQPRHIRCSPSRAQYIVHEDFPPCVDERPEYDKYLRYEESLRVEAEKAWTNAWIELQKDEEN